jgi:uncharacterized damage-inducible protein DinB
MPSRKSKRAASDRARRPRAEQARGRHGSGSPADMPQVLLETWAASERMHQLILQHLDARAWRAEPPQGQGRTIAAIYAHVHNIRRKWLRLTAPHLKLPVALHRSRCTREQAKAALAASGALCGEMLEGAWRGGGIARFRRDGWAPAWPAGAAMFAYMFAHEAHHRGQVMQLAHQLGYALPSKVVYGLWTWEKLWKECGFTTRPR